MGRFPGNGGHPVGEIRPNSERLPILLVEDEFDMAQEISLALERQGYSVRIAETESELPAAASAQPPVVMIVDRLLRGTDSLSMIEKLRGEGNKVPMLVISALS